MSLTKKIAFNTGAQFFGKIVNLSITFVSIAILTRYLGTSGYGQFTTAFAYVGFFAVFADLGFFTTLVRELSLKRYDGQRVVNNILTFRTLLALAVFLIGFIIAQFIPAYDPVVRSGILLASISLVFLTINQTLVGIFQANFRMDKGVIGDIIGKIVIALLLIWLVKYKISLTDIFGIYALANFVTLISSYILARKYLQIKPAFDFEIWKKVFRSTVSLGILLILGTLYFRNDMVILSFLKGPTEVGIYGASYKLFELLIVLPSMFLGAAFPVLTKMIGDKDERVGSVIQKSFNFLTLLAVPITVGGIFYAEKIINLVAGQSFVDSYTLIYQNIPITAVVLFKILMLNVVLIFLANLFNYIIIAAGTQRKLIWPNVIFVIVNIGLNILFIPKYGYLAAAMTTFITEILIFSVSAYFVTQKLMFKFRVLPILTQTIFASAVMILVIKVLGFLNFLILIPIGTIVYFVSLYLSGGINKEIVQEVFRRKNT